MFLPQGDLNHKRQVGRKITLKRDPFFLILYIFESIKVLRILLKSMLFIGTCRVTY